MPRYPLCLLLLTAAMTGVGCQTSRTQYGGCLVTVYHVPAVTVEEVQAAPGFHTGGYPVVQFPLPVFPTSMLWAGVTGEVTVRAEVRADGTVSKATVVKSSQAEFNAPAVQAVAKWRFVEYVGPGIKDRTGMTVDCRILFGFDREAQTAIPGLRMAMR